jgi:uncharacterized membrane protein
MPPGPDAPASGDLLSLRTYFFILGGALLWCALLVLAPVFSAARWESSAGILYTFFHRICHQIESRSLHIAGEPLAVCVRCTALYFGFLTGTVAYPFIRGFYSTRIPARGFLVMILLPMLLDVILGVTGVHEAGTATRLITGGIAGLVLPFFILPVATGAVQQLVSARRHTTIISTTEGLSDA